MQEDDIRKPRSEERPGILRMTALLVSVFGGAGSLVLMLVAGNPPVLLRILFAIWVLSPFAGLFAACLISKRWSPLTRRVLYSVTLLITIGSLGLYGDRVLYPPETTPAFRFIVVPFASWLLILITVPIAALISRRGQKSA